MVIRRIVDTKPSLKQTQLPLQTKTTEVKYLIEHSKIPQPAAGDAGRHVVFYLPVVILLGRCVSGLCSTTGGPLLAPFSPLPPFICTTVLWAARSSHLSSEDTVGDKPRHSAAGWGIDLPPHSSHTSASLPLTWRHAARPQLLLIVYMAPPVGRCIICTTYLHYGMTAASCATVVSL